MEIKNIKDIHIHTGYFNGGLYFSPEEVCRDMKALGVGRYYFSSTSTGSLPFKYIRREIEELISLSEGRAVPFLWVSPGMLRHSGSLRQYFFANNKFAGIKIHGLQGWETDSKALCKIFHIARDKNLPVMLHTGEDDICSAGAYKKLCLEFRDVKIILAHGRPFSQTLDVMKSCPNVFVDTAFMPVKNIVLLRKNNLLGRTLWGSDFPVMKYFYRTQPKKYYRARVRAVVSALGEEDFAKISCTNFSLIDL